MDTIEKLVYWRNVIITKSIVLRVTMFHFWRRFFLLNHFFLLLSPLTPLVFSWHHESKLARVCCTCVLACHFNAHAHLRSRLANTVFSFPKIKINVKIIVQLNICLIKVRSDNILRYFARCVHSYSYIFAVIVQW